MRIQSRSTIIDGMSFTTFNTLAASQNLQKAAALAEAVAMEIETDQYKLATKSDVQSVRNNFNWLKLELGTGGHGIQFKRPAELIALFGLFFTWL